MSASPAPVEKVIIIGLGNPILGDDGVGWRVVETIAQKLPVPGLRPGKGRFSANPAVCVEVDCLAVGGLSLMERLVDYPRAILVDAIFTGEKPPGTVTCFPLEALPNRAAGHLCSAHDTTLQNALEVGRKMGIELPGRIDIVAIEAENIYTFSEELTAPVAAAVPQAVQAVLELV